jgi:hypothetical protein
MTCNGTPPLTNWRSPEIAIADLVICSRAVWMYLYGSVIYVWIHFIFRSPFVSPDPSRLLLPCFMFLNNSTCWRTTSLLLSIIDVMICYVGCRQFFLRSDIVASFCFRRNIVASFPGVRCNHSIVLQLNCRTTLTNVKICKLHASPSGQIFRRLNTFQRQVSETFQRLCWLGLV